MAKQSIITKLVSFDDEIGERVRSQSNCIFVSPGLFLKVVFETKSIFPTVRYSLFKMSRPYGHINLLCKTKTFFTAIFSVSQTVTSNFNHDFGLEMSHLVSI